MAVRLSQGLRRRFSARTRPWDSALLERLRAQAVPEGRVAPWRWTRPAVRETRLHSRPPRAAHFSHGRRARDRSRRTRSARSTARVAQVVTAEVRDQAEPRHATARMPRRVSMLMRKGPAGGRARYIRQPDVRYVDRGGAVSPTRHVHRLTRPIRILAEKALDVVLYLRPRDTGPPARWWTDVERHAAGAPGIVRELLRGSRLRVIPRRPSKRWRGRGRLRRGSMGRRPCTRTTRTREARLRHVRGSCRRRASMPHVRPHARDARPRGTARHAGTACPRR
jgi:hypothetical protein